MQTYIKICDYYARHIRKKQFFEEMYAKANFIAIFLDEVHNVLSNPKKITW